MAKDINDDLLRMRSWPGYDMLVVTPIDKIFNIGDGVKEFGWTGSPACARSAWNVVKSSEINSRLNGPTIRQKAKFIRRRSETDSGFRAGAGYHKARAFPDEMPSTPEVFKNFFN